MTPRFSIVVPMRNLRQSAALLLRCLEAQSLPRSAFECVIVDDASTDGTADVIRSGASGLDLRLIQRPVNLGSASSRNAAIAASRGRILVFLDGDALPEPTWLADLEACFDGGRYDVVSGGRWHLDVGAHDPALQSKLAARAGVPEDELLRTSVAEQFAALSTHARLGHYPHAAAEATERELEPICTADPRSFLGAYSVITANVAVTAEMLARTSGFDPALRRAVDVELGIRLWEAGARFGFARGARAFHLYEADTAERTQSLNEYLGFFGRHPYRSVLLMAAWTMAWAKPPNRLDALGGLQALGETDGSDPRLDDELRRTLGLLPGDFTHTAEDVASRLSDTYGIDRGVLLAGLDRGRRTGLMTVGGPSAPRFDVDHSTNWLRANTTAWEASLRAQLDRHRALARRPAAPPIAYEGRYELTLPTDGFGPADVVLNVHLPLPCRYPAQGELHIGNVDPPDLLDPVDAARGVIAGYPVSAGRRSEVRLAFDFRCTVSESVGIDAAPEETGDRAFLALDADGRHLGLARRILAACNKPQDAPPRAAAEHLYRALLSRTRSLRHGHGDAFVAETGAGSCAERARLYVLLCRLASIPARERAGLLVPPAGHAAQPRRITGPAGMASLLHVWAEVAADGAWIPVDFLAWDMGARAMTWGNVRDPELREALERDTPAIDDYYFGRLDPFRIYLGREAHRLVTCATTPRSIPLERRLNAQATHRLWISETGATRSAFGSAP